MKHAFFKDNRHYRKIVKVGWIPKKNFTKSEEVPETSEAVKTITPTTMKTRMLRKNADSTNEIEKYVVQNRRMTRTILTIRTLQPQTYTK